LTCAFLASALPGLIFGCQQATGGPQATLAAAAPATTAQKETLRDLEEGFGAIAERVGPTVVSIEARATTQRPAAPTRPRGAPDEEQSPSPFRFPFPNPFDDASPFQRPGPEPSAEGSGVIVRQQGGTLYILTNAHVIDERDRIRVTLHDGRRYAAQVAGVDAKTDLAVLKLTVDRPLPERYLARLGDSRSVRVGQWAIAIGNPLGYASTLTVGVVSATGRTVVSPNSISHTDLIQTDASINLGNSGGPLVNIDGEVIGINTTLASTFGATGSIGIGFAIPVNTLKAVLDPLIQTGKVTRGWLGVQTSLANREMAPELRQHYGVPEGGALLEEVMPDSPAARAGLQSEDVIVRFGGRAVHSFGELEQAVSATPPNTRTPLVVVRDQRSIDLSVVLGERPPEEQLAASRRQRATPERGGGERSPGPQAVPGKFGLTVRQFAGGPGVEVAAVAPHSPAAEAGLAPGDVIDRVGRFTITDLASFRRAMASVREDQALVLRVRSARTGQRGTRLLRP
jgi:serine protease Do